MDIKFQKFNWGKNKIPSNFEKLPDETKPDVFHKEKAKVSPKKLFPECVIDAKNPNKIISVGIWKVTIKPSGQLELIVPNELKEQIPYFSISGNADSICGYIFKKGYFYKKKSINHINDFSTLWQKISQEKGQALPIYYQNNIALNLKEKISIKDILFNFPTLPENNIFYQININPIHQVILKDKNGNITKENTLVTKTMPVIEFKEFQNPKWAMSFSKGTCLVLVKFILKVTQNGWFGFEENDEGLKVVDRWIKEKDKQKNTHWYPDWEKVKNQYYSQKQPIIKMNNGKLITMFATHSGAKDNAPLSKETHTINKKLKATLNDLPKGSYLMVKNKKYYKKNSQGKKIVDWQGHFAIVVKPTNENLFYEIRAMNSFHGLQFYLTESPSVNDIGCTNNETEHYHITLLNITNDLPLKF